MGTQRRRLAPALRVAQILDAALQEFSASGYAGARMDDIALRAGLSKGGLYAHFSSKEAVFEALIARHLSPAPLDVEAVVDGASSTRDLAERIVDQLYVSLANPAMISAMRLLLAESARVPQLARAGGARPPTPSRPAWRACWSGRARGLCAGGVAQEHPWLLLSPIVHTMVACILLGPQERIDMARRRAHAALIGELLEAGGGQAGAPAQIGDR